jgi:class 3 adenylate cyclase
MPDDPLSRRLTTIVALDVAGYSARTEADEARTTAEVAALRRVIEGIATARGGRVFNTAGDGFMLEFGSSLAAVEAALALADQCEPKCGSACTWAMSWCNPTATSSATASTSRPA